MTNPIIQTDIVEVLKELASGQKEIVKEIGKLDSKIDNTKSELKEDINDVKISLETVKGEIKALTAEVKQLDKRIDNSEFTNRGILIGIIVVILGGAAKFFGLVK
jgi:predicted  nucleic acid-binding Zn-ribbon protein